MEVHPKVANAPRTTRTNPRPAPPVTRTPSIPAPDSFSQSAEQPIVLLGRLLNQLLRSRQRHLAGPRRLRTAILRSIRPGTANVGDGLGVLFHNASPSSVARKYTCVSCSRPPDVLNRLGETQREAGPWSRLST